jgi:hypothetical protein
VNNDLRQRDGRDIAVGAQTEMLRLLHRFGWLRTKDLASVAGRPMPKATPKADPDLQSLTPTRADIRRTQRHLVALRERRLILSTQAPNGSVIYALSERGARALQGLGVSATTGKDLLRSYHAAYFLHRNIANEIAIAAMRQGFRVSTEREIAQGRWLGGADGIHGKRPDVAVRAGSDCWFVEVERSHKNRTDHEHLLTYLNKTWANVRLGEPAQVASGHWLRRVVFICTPGFAKKLAKDLQALGWSNDELEVRVMFETSLYSFRNITFY